jgi:hypothetical protein
MAALFVNSVLMATTIFFDAKFIDAAADPVLPATTADPMYTHFNMKIDFS